MKVHIVEINVIKSRQNWLVIKLDEMNFVRIHTLSHGWISPMGLVFRDEQKLLIEKGFNLSSKNISRN